MMERAHGTCLHFFTEILNRSTNDVLIVFGSPLRQYYAEGATNKLLLLQKGKTNNRYRRKYSTSQYSSRNHY